MPVPQKYVFSPESPSSDAEPEWASGNDADRVLLGALEYIFSKNQSSKEVACVLDELPPALRDIRGLIGDIRYGLTEQRQFQDEFRDMRQDLAKLRGTVCELASRPGKREDGLALDAASKDGKGVLPTRGHYLDDLSICLQQRNRLNTASTAASSVDPTEADISSNFGTLRELWDSEAALAPLWDEIGAARTEAAQAHREARCTIGSVETLEGFVEAMTGKLQTVQSQMRAEWMQESQKLRERLDAMKESDNLGAEVAASQRSIQELQSEFASTSQRCEVQGGRLEDLRETLEQEMEDVRRLLSEIKCGKCCVEAGERQVEACSLDAFVGARGAESSEQRPLDAQGFLSEIRGLEERIEADLISRFAECEKRACEDISSVLCRLQSVEEQAPSVSNLTSRLDLLASEVSSLSLRANDEQQMREAFADKFIELAERHAEMDTMTKERARLAQDLVSQSLTEVKTTVLQLHNEMQVQLDGVNERIVALERSTTLASQEQRSKDAADRSQTSPAECPRSPKAEARTRGSDACRRSSWGVQMRNTVVSPRRSSCGEARASSVPTASRAGSLPRPVRQLPCAPVQLVPGMLPGRILSPHRESRGVATPPQVCGLGVDVSLTATSERSWAVTPPRRFRESQVVDGSAKQHRASSSGPLAVVPARPGLVRQPEPHGSSVLARPTTQLGDLLLESLASAVRDAEDLETLEHRGSFPEAHAVTPRRVASCTSPVPRSRRSAVLCPKSTTALVSATPPTSQGSSMAMHGGVGGPQDCTRRPSLMPQSLGRGLGARKSCNRWSTSSQ